MTNASLGDHRGAAHEQGARERGAIYVLFAIMVVILMAAAAIAVDLSAMEHRGQELQNTADAAALAAVAEWVDSGDSVAAITAARQVAVLDGTSTPENPALVSVEFPSEVEATVTVIDREAELYFSSLIGSDGATVTRQASASLGTCSTCEPQPVPLPRPDAAISAAGTGDGFAPIAVGNRRFYALNHNASNIVCVDRVLEKECWNARPAFPTTVETRTDSIVHAELIGDRIWYGGQTPDSYDLYCWDTTLDKLCPASEFRTLALLDANTALSNHFRTRGGGLAEVSGRLYAFTDDHLAHCYEPATGSDCGYGGGKPNGMAPIMPPLDPGVNPSLVGAGMDRIVHDDGRIYVSLHVAADGGGYTRGTWVHCWSTSSGSPCTGFTPSRMHTTAQPRHKGRLFFDRASDGTPTRVCSTDFGSITCTNINSGGPSQPAFTQLAGLMPPLPDDTVGVHTWHEPSNRLFLTTSHSYNEVHCWDFATNSYCGLSSISVQLRDENGLPVGLPIDAETYGFVYQDDCLYGLGHNAVFFTMDENGEPGCELTTQTTITPCTCSDGSRAWGRLEFDPLSLVSGGSFTKFEVQIIGSDGIRYVPSSQPDPTVPPSPPLSMIDHPTGYIDLGLVPATLDSIIVKVTLETREGADPWRDGTVPEVEVTWQNRPFLTD